MENFTKEEIDQEIKDLEQKKAQIEHEEQIKNKEAYKLSKQLEKLKVVRDKTEAAIIETTKELNKYCTHEKIRTEEYNSEGGYLNRAEYKTCYYCEWCGVLVDEKVTYGGYG
jgi:hypothetical protein